MQIDAARALASGQGMVAPTAPSPGRSGNSPEHIGEQRRHQALGLGRRGASCHWWVYPRPRPRPQRPPRRNRVESAVKPLLMACSGVAILTTIGIVLSLVFETMRFFGEVSPWEFLYGLKWSAQTNIRPDQISLRAFGAVPLIYGSLMITIIAMIVATPKWVLRRHLPFGIRRPRMRAVM